MGKLNTLRFCTCLNFVTLKRDYLDFLLWKGDPTCTHIVSFAYKCLLELNSHPPKVNPEFVSIV